MRRAKEGLSPSPKQIEEEEEEEEEKAEKEEEEEAEQQKEVVIATSQNIPRRSHTQCCMTVYAKRQETTDFLSSYSD